MSQRLRLNPSSSNRSEAQTFATITRMEPAEGVILARAADFERQSYWSGIPWKYFTRVHSQINGASGNGKTYFVISLLTQYLQNVRTHKGSVVIADMKGELASFLIDTLIPAWVAVHGPDILKSVRVVRPFDRDFLPLLRVTQAEPGVERDIQAMGLTTAIEQGLSSEIGSRMTRIFLHMILLAIELDQPLTVLKTWIECPEVFIKAANKSDDQSVRSYASTYAERENKASVDALLSRLDSFLFLRDTRLALSAPSCVSFAEALESGITILDLGNPPAGVEKVARFWAGVLLGKLTRAILSRPVTPESGPCFTVYEECQEALAGDRAEQFGRLLALARFKMVFLSFVNQQNSQIAAVAPALVRILETNTQWQASFRCNAKDAKAFVHALPITGNKDRAALVRMLTSLPRRHMLLWLKELPCGAQLVKSPRIDLERLHLLAAKVPADIRRQIAQGTCAVPRAELERLVVPPPISTPKPRKVIKGDFDALGLG